jgi:hypothetical protein
MPDVGAHHLLQVAAADDQKPIEALAAQAADPTLGVGLRPWRPHRRPDHAKAVGAEHLVEAARELAVAVTDEEAYWLLPLGERHHEVACLLGDPALARIRNHTTKVPAAAAQLDEEQHVQPAQPDGVDGQEVADDDRRGLRARNASSSAPPAATPARSCAGAESPRRCSARARSRADQLALDASIAPGRVLNARAAARARRCRCPFWGDRRYDAIGFFAALT